MYMINNIGGFHHLHPFKNNNDKIVIPFKYRELYLECYDDIDTIPYTEYNIKRLVYIYIASFWINSWYNDSITWTPRTILYKLDDENVIFDTPKFARLNSVSPKKSKPIYNLDEAKQLILQSPRCKNVMDKCIVYDLPIYIAIRDWIEIDKGNEFRCFCYNDKLTAICTIDDKISDINDTQLIERVNVLLAKCVLPFYDAIVDVFLSDNFDCIIEFNSYGIWANGTSGEFNWFTDEYELKDSNSVTIKRFKI